MFRKLLFFVLVLFFVFPGDVLAQTNIDKATCLNAAEKFYQELAGLSQVEFIDQQQIWEGYQESWVYLNRYIEDDTLRCVTEEFYDNIIQFYSDRQTLYSLGIMKASVPITDEYINVVVQRFVVIWQYFLETGGLSE